MEDASPIGATPWSGGGLPLLNVAATTVTYALGPELRAVVWVQGCPFTCPGCIAPDWIPMREARLVNPAELARELLANPRVTGLTFSGGEPMLQAAGLAMTARLARAERDLSLICYSGFRLEQLHRRPPGPGVGELLTELDILIDGQYVEARNDNRGMRGSSNQRVHFLSDRLRHFADLFEGGPRRAEIQVAAEHVLLVGVPPQSLAGSFEQVARQATQKVWREVKQQFSLSEMDNAKEASDEREENSRG